MCFLAQNNIVSGIFASNLLRLKNHQLFRELLVENIPIYEQLKKDYTNINIYPVENPNDAMKSVSIGNTDAFVGSFIVAGYAMQKYQFPNLKIAGHAEYKDFLYHS